MSTSITRYESHKPALPSGSYTVKISQHLTGTGINQNDPFEAEKEFRVEGPQFALPPDVTHAVYPPENSQADYTETLPHIVLNSGTLPWERSAVSGDTATPWLVLLLFHEDDKDDYKSAVIPINQTNDGSGDDYLKNTSAWPYTGDEGAYVKDRQVQVVKVKKSLLTAILPAAEELSLLTHVRKEEGEEENAAKAVIIGNRCVKPGQTNTVHLVSVEHRYLENSFDYQSAQVDEMIPLVSLKSWTFSSTDLYKITPSTIRSIDSTSNALKLHLWKHTGNTYDSQEKLLSAIREGFSETIEDSVADYFKQGHFEDILKHLNQNPSSLRLPVSADSAVAKSLQKGCVPVPHYMQQGARALSWYHGPLSPLQSHGTAVADILPVMGSDSLLQYDQANNMLDVSYSAAWELGRLLGLRNKKFSTGIYHWKRNHRHSRINGEENHPVCTPISGEAEDHGPLPSELLDWLSDLWLLKGLPFNYLVPDEAMLPIESIRLFTIDNNWRKCLIDGAFSIGRTSKQYLEDDQQHYVEIIKNTLVENLKTNPSLKNTFIQDLEDAKSCIKNILMENLKDKSADININSLFPENDPLHDKLIEILENCCFIIDIIKENVESFPENSALLRNELLDVLKKDSMKNNIMRAIEDSIIKKAKNDYDEKVTGFLLRSEAVSGWPDLMVEGYTIKPPATDNDKIKLLRTERLSDHVLLCLFKGEVKSFSMHIKPGAMHFERSDCPYKDESKLVLNISNYKILTSPPMP